MEVFTEREAAKELRVFSAIGFLRRRYNSLSDERIAKVREFVRGRFAVALVGTLGTALGTAVALGALIALLVDDRIDVATAASAVIAMILLGSRLSTVSGALGTLLESSLFVTDLERFLEHGERHAERSDGGGDPGQFETLSVEHLSFSLSRHRPPGAGDVSLDVRRGEVSRSSARTALARRRSSSCSAASTSSTGQIAWNGRDVPTSMPIGCAPA